MQLPGRLRYTTLGDLLGTLHRAQATGTLEIIEDRGRAHRVHVAQGLVVGVELDGAAPSLAEILRGDRAADDDVLRRSLLRAMASRRLHGEVLVDEFQIAPAVVDGALRRQLQLRLACLDRVADGRVSFRVAVRAPESARRSAPLPPREFLHGRRRARERAVASDGGPERDAWRALGLEPGADPDAIKRAYRRLARATHPDLHPRASDDERRALEARFSAITDAYRRLVA